MTALFVEQLTVIDFSYFHQDRGILGESWIFDLELSGDLDDQGMIFDFAHVKKQVKAHIDQLIDHKFVIPQGYSGVEATEEGENLKLELKTRSGMHFRHISPPQAVVLLDSNEVSIDSVSRLLHSSLRDILPSNVTEFTVNLRSETIAGAYYHYSHGLKHHFGDCQRIAHGHRSKIQVYKNQARAPELEAKIAKQWEDIYLITQEDLLPTDLPSHYRLAYQANQGYFELLLPKSCCDLLPTDTTVELIAEFLAERIKASFPDDEIKVRAFEGVQKGAIAIRR